MYKNDLLLLSGNDIPFPEAKIVIHPPTISEISLIGEDVFYEGCGLLLYSKSSELNDNSSSPYFFSNFEVILTLLKEQTPELQQTIQSYNKVMQLLFADYEISYDAHNIIFHKDGIVGYLNISNYDKFQEIIRTICGLSGKHAGEQDFVDGPMARRIREKLEERRRKLAQLKKEQEYTGSTFAKMVSVLAVGENKDINSLMNYTIYQLFDEYARYFKKYKYDAYISYRLAGAENLEEIEDWTNDLDTPKKDPQSQSI